MISSAGRRQKKKSRRRADTFSRAYETAALKIKASVSNGRVKLSALRRLFFFCRRPAGNLYLFRF